jgi:beta-barrel assembly-enhancing protease
MYAATAVALLAAVSLAAQQRSNDVARAADKESALGRQMAAEILRHSTPIHNPDVDRYLTRLGRQLSAQFPDTQSNFTFTVVADDPCSSTHEPAALPGGSIIVPAALFVAADDEAEFAAMLAHAMEHVAQHHGTRPAAQGQIADITIPVISIGAWGGCSDQALIPVNLRASVRNEELEADALAIGLAASAGFDPGALARYIARVQAPSPTASGVLPSRDERLAAMQPIIRRFPLADSQVSSSEFIAIQREVSAIELQMRRPKWPGR